MFKKNRAAGNGMSLDYITPQYIDGEIVVQLEKKEVERETEKWKCALIVYAIGDCPGYNAMTRFVAQNWNIAEPCIYMHEQGYFVVKFQSMEDTQEILLAVLYSINYRPLILKQWSAEFGFSKEFPTDIPLSVKLPHLPLNCLGPNTLSRISSTIGTPMFADECTTKQTRVSFARMLLEVNVTKPLPDKITVKDPKDIIFTQSVIYE